MVRCKGRSRPDERSRSGASPIGTGEHALQIPYDEASSTFAAISDVRQPVSGTWVRACRAKARAASFMLDSNSGRRNYSVPIAIMLTSVHHSASRAA